MSTLPLLLLLLLQSCWSIEANDEDSRRNQLNLFQREFNKWDRLPVDLSFSTLSTICSTIMNISIIQHKFIPDVSRMSFVLQQDACNRVSIPLTEVTDLWTTPGFSPDRSTVIFITGWTTTINRSNSGPVAKAFACRDDTNFIILDAAKYIRTFYTWSALNTETIGQIVAEALYELDIEYVTRNVHLVGHSLGAQIAGAAGRHYQWLTGRNLPRITGLDPANPCFYDGSQLPGTRKGDADYVDIIYTNPGVAGVRQETGDGNFYVEGLRPIKSGCTGLNAIGCSHQRAVDYFTESVYPNNELNFKGRSCATFMNLWTGNACRGRSVIMGYAARRSGLFYVDANRAEPFGKDANPNTFTPSDSVCGTCIAE